MTSGRDALQRKMTAYARAGWQGVLNAVFPPVCLLCSAETEQAGLVCAACFERLVRVEKPFCVRCATPQPSVAYLNAQGECVRCEKAPPPWAAARAAFLYEGTARSLVLQLKYADRVEHTGFLADHLRRAGQDILQPNCLVVPVPSHWRRRLWRRYNQAALLAQTVARKAGLVCVPDMLYRAHATTRLSGFSRRARYQEMAQAIALRPHYKNTLRGQHVVLVDDLLTSGATASVCTHALLEGGAASVSVLVVALVPMQKEIDLDSPISETA